MTAQLSTPGGGLSRRTLLRGGFAAGSLGLVGALSGCGSALSAGVAGTALDPGTLTFWNLFGGGDGARLQVMLDHYAKANGGSSSLQAATFAWGNPYYTKVSLATLGNKPPDVAVAHLTRAKNLAQADLLTPITDDMLSLVGLKSTDFNQKVWSAQKLHGKSWLVPLDTHPYVLYYNKTVCQKAGLLDAQGVLKPIKGAQEWEAALTAAQKATGQYAVTTSDVADTSTPWRLFTTLYHQMSGATPFLSGGGTELTVDDDLAMKSLEYIKKMSDKGWLVKTVDYATAGTLMYTGKSAFYLMGPWEITTAQAVKGLKFGIAPIPQIFDEPATQADSHTFILPRMDRTPEQMKRAMGFIKSMLDQSLTWAMGGHIPSYLPTLSTSAYKKLTPQNQYFTAADHAVYDDPAWYSGSGGTFENIVGAQIGLVQQGLTTPAGALSAMKSQLQTYVDTPSPL